MQNSEADEYSISFKDRSLSESMQKPRKRVNKQLHMVFTTQRCEVEGMDEKV
jgi:hypothetical protein